MTVEIDIPEFMKREFEERGRQYAIEQERLKTARQISSYNRQLEKSKVKVPTSAFIADAAQNTMSYVSEMNGNNAKKAILPAFLLGATILTYAIFPRDREAKAERVKAEEQNINPENIPENADSSDFINPLAELTDEEMIVYKRVNPYSETLKFVSMATGRDALLYASLIGAESDFNPKAVSGANAKGLAQMTSIAFDELERTRQGLESRIQFYEIWPDSKNSEKLNSLKEKLNTLNVLTGGKISRKEYASNPDYQIQLGMAYFDILADYFSQPEFSGKYGLNPIEAAASAYNCGITRTKKLISDYGAEWNEHKPEETDIHWERIVHYGQMLESIQDKLEDKLLAMNAEQENEIGN